MDLWWTLQVTLVSSLVVTFKAGGSVSINSAIFAVTLPGTSCWTTVLTWGKRRLWPFLFAPLSVASLPWRFSGFRPFSRAFRCWFSSSVGAFEVPVWSPSRLNLSFAGFISHLVPLLFGVCYVVSACVSIVGGCFFRQRFAPVGRKLFRQITVYWPFFGPFWSFSGAAFGAVLCAFGAVFGAFLCVFASLAAFRPFLAPFFSLF